MRQGFLIKAARGTTISLRLLLRPATTARNSLQMYSHASASVAGVGICRQTMMLLLLGHEGAADDSPSTLLMVLLKWVEWLVVKLKVTCNGTFAHGHSLTWAESLARLVVLAC